MIMGLKAFSYMTLLFHDVQIVNMGMAMGKYIFLKRQTSISAYGVWE